MSQGLSAKAWEHQVATWTLTSGETEAQSKAVPGQVVLEGVEADRSAPSSLSTPANGIFLLLLESHHSEGTQ